MADKHWIEHANIKKNALHNELGVPAGQKIPPSKIAKAANSDNPLLAKRARLAETFAKLRNRR